MLIGHSLGGAAVLGVAQQVPESIGVVTIGSPADASHVAHNFAAHIEDIEEMHKKTIDPVTGRLFMKYSL